MLNKYFSTFIISNSQVHKYSMYSQAELNYRQNRCFVSSLDDGDIRLIILISLTFLLTAKKIKNKIKHLFQDTFYVYVFEKQKSSCYNDYDKPWRSRV